MKTLLNNLNDWLIGIKNPNAVRENDIKAGYANHNPSLPDHLFIVDFCDEHNVFLLGDGASIGSGFELASIPAEAASPDHLEAVFNKIRDTFATVVPLHKENPWIMQMYVNDEYSLKPVLSHIQHNIEPKIAATQFTQDYLTRLDDLFTKMARPEGLFLDPITDAPFRGRRRRVRVLFYRIQPVETRTQAFTEHKEVMTQIESKLKSPGLQLKRLTGKDYYQWWVRWFNANPDALLERFPYPSQEKKPASFNLNQSIFFTPAESDEHGFVFDGYKHRVLYVDGLKETPEIGLLSRERPQANPKHRYALLDRLPEGATYTIQVVFSNDEALDAHLMRLEKGIVGTSLKPQQVRDDIKTARNELAMGNRLFWVNQAVYYRAKTDEEIQQVEKELSDLFINAKMPLIASQYDFHLINSYLNSLPFNFNPTFARKYLRFDRLLYASELAALLPVYGRNQGARHLPCFTFFNRLGEPVLFDVLHTDFISQNSHFALFANSGGGKSVAMGWMINSLMAVKNARIVLFEMGNSFDRVLIHAKAYGKQTKQLLLSNQKSKAVPLNPFCEAYLAIPEISENLSEEKAMALAQKMMDLKSHLNQQADATDIACDEDSRSYLAELSLALRTMITEANAREEENFTLADETLLIEILSDAILTSFKADIPQMLTEHVVQAFARRLEIEDIPRKKDRILDMHDRLKSYVINSNKSRFFNVPTEPLGDFDIFHIDISAIKDDKGKLALVMVSLLPRILAMAEASQHDNRPTFLFIDESHIQFQIPSVVTCALLLVKVARKLGLWLVPSTQNVTDMNSEMSTKILSLIETWILLGIPGCTDSLQAIEGDLISTYLPADVREQALKFHRQCFLEARNTYQTEAHDAPQVEGILKRYGGEEDLKWMGSQVFQSLYYSKIYARQPVRGFTFHEAPNTNLQKAADRGDIDAKHLPENGYPSCKQWWGKLRKDLVNVANHASLFDRHLNYTAVLDRVRDFKNTHPKAWGSEISSEDYITKMLLNDSQDVQANSVKNLMNNTNGAFSGAISHSLVNIGQLTKSWTSTPLKREAIMQTLPVMQAFIYFFIIIITPVVLAFSGYNPKTLGSLCGLFIMAIFLQYLWHLVGFVERSVLDPLGKNDAIAAMRNMAVMFYFIAPMLLLRLSSHFGGEAGSALSGLISATNEQSEKVKNSGVETIKHGAKIAGAGRI